MSELFCERRAFALPIKRQVGIGMTVQGAAAVSPGVSFGYELGNGIVCDKESRLPRTTHRSVKYMCLYACLKLRHCISTKICLFRSEQLPLRPWWVPVFASPAVALKPRFSVAAPAFLSDFQTPYPANGIAPKCTRGNHTPSIS